jgi:hypothetical protein
MTGAELMGVVLFGIAVFGTIFGVFKFLDGKFGALREKLDGVDKDLSEHKVHAAENFATKAGMHEQTNQIMRAIETVGSRLDSGLAGLSDRLDRLYENPPRRTPTR